MEADAPGLCTECLLPGYVIATDQMRDARDLPHPKHRRKADLEAVKLLGMGCRVRLWKCAHCGNRWSSVEVLLEPLALRLALEDR